MNSDLKRIIYVFVILLVQCILDHFVDLGLYLHIFILPIIILTLQYKYKTIPAMVVAFMLGLIMDIITSGVLGLYAGSLVAAAVIRQKLLYSIQDVRNIDRHDRPDYHTLGHGKSTFYVAALHFVFCAAYVLLDNMGLTPFGSVITRIMVCFVANTIIGLLLFRKYRKQ